MSKNKNNGFGWDLAVGSLIVMAIIFALSAFEHMTFGKFMKSFEKQAYSDAMNSQVKEEEESIVNDKQKRESIESIKQDIIEDTSKLRGQFVFAVENGHDYQVILDELKECKRLSNLFVNTHISSAKKAIAEMPDMKERLGELSLKSNLTEEEQREVYKIKRKIDNLNSNILITDRQFLQVIFLENHFDCYEKIRQVWGEFQDRGIAEKIAEDNPKLEFDLSELKFVIWKMELGLFDDDLKDYHEHLNLRMKKLRLGLGEL